METNGLFLGIDIDEYYSQICYYDTNDRSVQSVQYKDDSSFFINGKRLTEIMNDEDAREEAIAGMIQFMIQEAIRVVGDLPVRSVCICLHDYSAGVREVFNKALDILSIPKSDRLLISSPEAFAYYAFSAEPALYAQGAVLYDFRENGISACFLHRLSFKGMTVLRETDEFSDDSAICLAGSKKDPDMAAEELTSFFEESLEGRKVSGIYLTGPGFDIQGNPPQSLVDVLSKGGRRIFAGQNLYVKGACICAIARCLPMADPFRSAGIFRNVSLAGDKSISGGGRYSRCIMVCRGRLTSDISVRILEGGQSVLRELVSAGMNMDEAGQRFECILTDDQGIIIEMHQLGANTKTLHRIDLSSLPKRDDKTARISVDFFFPDEETCEITVNDIALSICSDKKGQTIKSTLIIDPSKNPGSRQIKGKGVIFCSGRRASRPYVFPETEANIYTLEELVYYLYNNIYLVSKEVINDDLFRFLDECSDSDELSRSVRSASTYDEAVLVLFNNISYYSREEIDIIRPVLEDMSTTDPILKKYARADAFIKNDCYTRAAICLEEILERPRNNDMPASFYSKVHHNLGVCYARMLMYERAALCFEEAYEERINDDSKRQAMLARQLSGTAAQLKHSQEEEEAVKKQIEETKQKTANEFIKADEQIDTKTLKELIRSLKEDYIHVHL